MECISNLPLESSTCSGESPEYSTFSDRTQETLTSDSSQSNGSHTEEMYKDPIYNSLANQIVQAPYDYVCSLPSKGVRDRLINSLNNWLLVPEESVSSVKEVISLLHNSSLILDDFQDRSPLRRGRPSTHTVFGPAQAINSSSYAIVEAISKIQNMSGMDCAKSATKKIVTIFKGQAMDLHWTYNSECPSVEQYMQMISDKTGALFELAFQLLVAQAPFHISQHVTVWVDRLMDLLGRYFQIRDDYQNLMSADYANEKGFCEDLDEGKYSLPLLHCLHSDRDNLLMQYILSTRRERGELTRSHKILVLEQLKDCGSLEWTRSTLNDLYCQLIGAFETLEEGFGKPNPELRGLIELLRV